MRKILPVMLLVLCVGQTKPVDSVDAAEAVRRGVSVQQIQIEHMQAELSTMRTDLEKAQARIKSLEAATQPKASPATSPKPLHNSVSDKLNSMPANLWRSLDETPLKKSSREVWLRTNMKDPIPATVDMVIRTVTAAHVNPVGNVSRGGTGGEDHVRAAGTVTLFGVWGEDRDANIAIRLDNLKPEEALDWKSGKVIRVTGSFLVTASEAMNGTISLQCESKGVFVKAP